MVYDLMIYAFIGGIAILLLSPVLMVSNEFSFKGIIGFLLSVFILVTLGKIVSMALV